MVTLTCPSCRKVHQVDETFIGKRVQCKDCGAAFEVRANAPQPAARSYARESAQEEGAMAGSGGHSRGAAVLEEPEELPLQLPQAAAPAKAQRALGLVWLTFYWIITGIGCLVGGYALAMMGTALGGASEMSHDMFGSRFGDSGSGAMGAAFLEFLGLLVFHYGLLLLVACYGLWTFRKWGLSLARGLAVASAVLSLIACVLSLINRVGIVASLVSLVISAGILVYLFGAANLRDRLQRVMPKGGLQEGSWNQYQ